MATVPSPVAGVSTLTNWRGRIEEYVAEDPAITTLRLGDPGRSRLVTITNVTGGTVAVLDDRVGAHIQTLAHLERASLQFDPTGAWIVDRVRSFGDGVVQLQHTRIQTRLVSVGG